MKKLAKGGETCQVNALEAHVVPDKEQPLA